MALFSQDSASWVYGSTPIENLFLSEYLPSAPGDFLRVYLYLRMVCLNPTICDSIEELGTALHMEEDALFNALEYWTRQGLLIKLTDNPPTYSVVPIRESKAQQDPMEKAYYTFRDFNGRLQDCFGTDNLLHPKQYDIAVDWLQLYGFDQEAVLRAVQLQLAKSRSRHPNIENFFKTMNKRLADWAEKGIRTVEDIEQAYAAEGTVGKVATLVAKTLGIRRNVTKPETELVATWVNEWKLTDDEILDACKATVRTSNPSFSYVDAVLRSRVSGDDKLHAEVVEVLKALGAGARVTDDAMGQYSAWMSEGYEARTILLAAVQCGRKNRRKMEDIRWILTQWADLGLREYDDIERYLEANARIAEEIRTLLDMAGSDRRPAKSDLKYLEAWKKNFSDELIHFAAECAQGADKPFAYMDKLLKVWQSEGATDVEAARAKHAAGRPSTVMNPALNYEQRPADDDTYSGLFVDLTQDPDNIKP